MEQQSQQGAGRVIKFRAWDGKQIVEGAAFLRSDGDAELAAFEEGRQIIWLQFTGLTDKNGTEIYERDILQLHCGSQDGVFNSHGVKAEVVWKDTGFSVSIPDKKVIANGGSMKGQEVSWREMHTWVGMHECLFAWTSKLEIVGNSYEDPELLK